MLRLENVAMRYGQGPEVLHGVNLDLSPSEFVFMMGPSGAGKTSLLHLMGLIHTPSRGRIKIHGRDVRSMSRTELCTARRRIGIVFQEFRLLDHLSAYDNVAVPLRISGGKDRQIRTAVAEVLDWLGLSELIDVCPPQMSTGQRQLVAAARAIIRRPDLLLCDEPTSNIDTRFTARLMRVFAKLADAGTTVVLSTHHDDLVDRHPYRVIHLARGRVIGPSPVRPAMAAAD